VTILKAKSKITIFLSKSTKIEIVIFAKLYLISISSCFNFLQQLMDVTGLKDYTILVVIIVLMHVGEDVGLQHPAGTTL